LCEARTENGVALTSTPKSAKGKRKNMATPKFGTPAWRKLYAPKKKRNAKKRRSTAKRKTAKKKKTQNPWKRPKQVRVRKGRLEVR
jgi:hypothetical protein